MNAFKTLTLAALLVTVAMFSFGCDEEGEISTPFGDVKYTSQPNTSDIDLLVADGSRDTVNYYADILGFNINGGDDFPTPDFTLDSTAGINNPTTVLFAQDDIIVCDRGSDMILIFRDIDTIASGDAPDTTLSAGISNPRFCVYHEGQDTLIVANNDNDTVFLYRDFQNIAAGADPVGPDVTLDNGGSLVDDPLGIGLSGDDLLVANNGANDAGEPCVTIYQDITTLADTDAPDIRLDADTSFLGDGLTVFPSCANVRVEDDTLFVGTRNAELFIFNNLSDLQSNDVPDTVLFGPDSYIDAPHSPTIVGQILWVPNRNGNLEVCEDEVNGLVGFSLIDSTDGSSGASNLTTGQLPDFMISSDRNFPILSTNQVQYAGGAFFANSMPETCNFNLSNIHIWYDGMSLQENYDPEITLNTSLSGSTIQEFVVSFDTRVNSVDPNFDN